MLWAVDQSSATTMKISSDAFHSIDATESKRARLTVCTSTSGDIDINAHSRDFDPNSNTDYVYHSHEIVTTQSRVSYAHITHSRLCSNLLKGSRRDGSVGSG